MIAVGIGFTFTACTAEVGWGSAVALGDGGIPGVSQRVLFCDYGLNGLFEKNTERRFVLFCRGFMTGKM